MTAVPGALVFLVFVVLGVAGFRRVVRRRRAAVVHAGAVPTVPTSIRMTRR